jgi:hypothetical protein
MRRTMPMLRMELFSMCKNANSAMPVAPKLWLMSKRHEPSHRRPAARPDFNPSACFSGDLESSSGSLPLHYRKQVAWVIGWPHAIRLDISRRKPADPRSTR